MNVTLDQIQSSRIRLSEQVTELSWIKSVCYNKNSFDNKEAIYTKHKLVTAFLKEVFVVTIKHISCLRTQIHFRDNAFLTYRSFARSHGFIVESFCTQITFIKNDLCWAGSSPLLRDVCFRASGPTTLERSLPT